MEKDDYDLGHNAVFFDESRLATHGFKQPSRLPNVNLIS